MLSDQILKFGHHACRFFFTSLTDGMTGHRNHHAVSRGILYHQRMSRRQPICDKLTIDGNTSFSLWAAHSALGLPPFKQSSN